MPSEMALEDIPAVVACMLLGETFEACCRSAGSDDGLCALVECVDLEAREMRGGCGCGRVEAACDRVELEADLAKACQAVGDCCEDSSTTNEEWNACMEGGVFTLPGYFDVLIPMLPDLEATATTSTVAAPGGGSSNGSMELDDTSGAGANMGRIWVTWTLVGSSLAMLLA